VGSQIELCKVTKAFDARSPAIESIDLLITDGERVAVLGPSGSGKTTLLRLIAGLESPDSGTIRIGGQDMRGVPPYRRNVAMVFQNPALYPYLSVGDNLAFGLKAQGLGRVERALRVGEVADMLGLWNLLPRRPDALSGGERQRVALGRAVARNPDILLLDEPFSNLDEPLRAALRREVLELHRRFGPTIVHVTHDQGEALCIGQRLAVLHQGRLMQFDVPREVYERPAHRFVASFVGEPGMNLLECDVLVNDRKVHIYPAGGPSTTRLLTADENEGSELPPDQTHRLQLGVRLESICITEDAPIHLPDSRTPVLVLPGTLQGLEYQGHSVLATLQMGNQVLLARLRSDATFREGQPVLAHLDLSRASWFDAVSGRRRELHCQSTIDAIG
jgi:ABC-type sugar transport system ATPase subunit